MPLPASGCTTPDLSTKSGLICVKSLFASNLQAELQKHNFVNLGIRPREQVIRTLVAVKCESNRYKSCWKSCHNCGNLRAFPVLHCQRHHRDCYTPTPVPPVGSAECPSMSCPFTKIASTRVGCPPFTAILITRSFSRVKVL